MVRETYKKILEVRENLTKWVDSVSSINPTKTVEDLMNLRNYTSEEMYKVLLNEKVFRLDSLTDAELFGITGYETFYKDFGFITEAGDFIESGRYCIPIRDVKGLVTALVGWYADQKKYVTTPTFGFVRDAQFFNANSYDDESYRRCGGKTFLVEGIFDTLSVKALGFPCLGNMGLDMSAVKAVSLKRYSAVIPIPDNDKSGDSTKVGGQRAWRIENIQCIVELPSQPYYFKDIDDLIKVCEVQSVKEELTNILRKGKFQYKIK
jgi:hypothetical protein